MEKYIPKFMDHLYNEDILEHIRFEEVRDAFHTNQIESKKEVIRAFDKLNARRVLYIGAWIGYLTHYLLREYPVEVRELDVDFRSKIISNMWNWDQPGYLGNMTMDIIYFRDWHEFDTIINCSTEHVSNDWFNLMPMGTQVIMQSNNLKHKTHINTCDDLEQMKQKFPLSHTVHASTVEFHNYNRFTLAGIK